MEGARRHRKDRHDIQELVHLHRLKLPTREAARDLGMSRSTLRRCHELLSEAGLLDDPLDELPSLEALAAAAPERVRPPQTSCAAPQADRITTLVRDGSRRAAILQRLRSENGVLDARCGVAKSMCRQRSRRASPAAVTGRPK